MTLLADPIATITEERYRRFSDFLTRKFFPNEPTFEMLVQQAISRTISLLSDETKIVRRPSSYFEDGNGRDIDIDEWAHGSRREPVCFCVAGSIYHHVAQATNLPRPVILSRTSAIMERMIPRDSIHGWVGTVTNWLSDGTARQNLLAIEAQEYLASR